MLAGGVQGAWRTGSVCWEQGRRLLAGHLPCEQVTLPAEPPALTHAPTSPMRRTPSCPRLQLAAMARDDPASLASVANLVVGRRGVGSVRWLEPTDVRGLDLDATVQLSKGSIEVSACGRCQGRCTAAAGREGALCGGSGGAPGGPLAAPQACTLMQGRPSLNHVTHPALPTYPPTPLQVYLDEGTKPEVGRGLNKPAEVTMLRIHKLDRDTGRPTADPEAVDRCVRVGWGGVCTRAAGRLGWARCGGWRCGGGCSLRPPATPFTRLLALPPATHAPQVCAQAQKGDCGAGRALCFVRRRRRHLAL